MHIKKIFIFILFFINFKYGFAQQEILGKVIDGENGAVLSNVHIINLENKNIVISNHLGEFKLAEAGNYKFTSIGYHDELINIVDSRYIIVPLHMKSSELNEVIVSTNQLPVKLKKAVAAISIISTQEIERGNKVNVSQVLNRVPGVYMHTGALNTNRITIRGIGSRNLFGTAKIRAYYEDIPLTTGNGETAIEDFDLDNISRIEIIKGAASSIYGAGLGGAIHLIPKKSYFDNTIVSSDFTLGSFGLNKGVLNFSHGSPKHSYRAMFSSTHSDGYRDNNEYDRQNIAFTSNHYLSHTNEISIVGSFVDLKAFIPSSINENDFINNPRSAAFTWAESKGFEDAQRGIFGLSWKHQYYDKLNQKTSIFTSFRNAYEARPFNMLDENTLALGLRSRLIGNNTIFKKKLDWTVGGELFRDQHLSKTFENLYQEFPKGTGAVQGELLSDFKEKRTYYNFFLEVNYHWNHKTMFSLGLNFNKTAYQLEDKFIAIGNIDQSGKYEFKGVFSPKLGISHLLSENTSLYTNLGHGFSPPTLSETLLPDGQINTGIEPETGWNFELGTRGSLHHNKLQYKLAFFRLNIRNLLVARRIADDQFIGINAGKTQHDGLELALTYHLMDTKVITVDSYFSYTLNNFVFKEFVDDNQNFSGNDLTGVPSEIFNAGVDINTSLGIYGSINFQYVGSIPITDSNSLYSNSYALTNIKLGYKFKLFKKLTLNTYMGLDNVFDKTYASQLLINASSFGGRAPRYYYPGNPLNFYAGINIKYAFF